MPSAESRRIWSPMQYPRKPPQPAPAPGAGSGSAPPTPSAPVSMPTPLPEHLQRHPAMISSLPGVSTTLDGPTRQFYAAGNLPTRRVALPA